MGIEYTLIPKKHVVWPMVGYFIMNVIHTELSLFIFNSDTELYYSFSPYTLHCTDVDDLNSPL